MDKRPIGMDSLLREIRRLEDENKLIKEKYNCEPMLDLVRERDAAVAENARLRKALKACMESAVGQFAVTPGDRCKSIELIVDEALQEGRDA